MKAKYKLTIRFSGCDEPWVRDGYATQKEAGRYVAWLIADEQRCFTYAITKY